MTFRFVHTQNATYPAVVLCRVREGSRGGYYAWRKREVQPDARRQRGQVLQATLRKRHADIRVVHGSPQLTVAAKAAGIAIGPTLWRA